MRVLALLLCLVLLAGSVLAAPLQEAEQVDKAMAEMAGVPAGRLLAQEDWLPAGNSVSDWTAMAFAMGGVEERYGDYLEALKAHVTQAYQESGCLDRIKATEYHRIALTVLALGGDPTQFGEDGDAVNLIADGTYAFQGELGKQGLNSWIFALITLDAANYAVPENAKYTRETMMEAICTAQEPDGGFGLAAGSSDVDITAMALQALAPYQERCRETVERALNYLASRMTEECGFVSYGAENVESAAQVVIALCALGLDPAQETQFCRGEQSLLTGIARYRQPDGTYSHGLEDGEGNLMATEQALLALLAVERLRNEGARLYDFTGYQAPLQKNASSAIWIITGGALLVICVVAAILVRRKGRKPWKD